MKPVGKSRRPKFATQKQYQRDQREKANEEESSTAKRPKPKNNSSLKPKQPTDEELSVNTRKKEEPSVNGRKKDKDNTIKAARKVSTEVQTAVDDYVTKNCTVEELHSAFEALESMEVEKKEHEKCCQNQDRCRSPDIPCLDESRVVLEPKEDDKNSCDFIHANKLTFEGLDKEYIVTQAPMQNTQEDFWRMVFQNQSAVVIVLCIFFEDGKEASDLFWPQKQGDYKYFGKMFINNKKTENQAICNIYTIEVLPDGCSNSLITKIYHFTSWEPAGAPANQRMLLRLMRTAKNSESGPTTVVSSEGIGRACSYVLIDAVTLLLCKGIQTKLIDVATRIRKQRAYAFKGYKVVLYAAALAILDYIRAKMPKHRDKFDQLKIALQKDEA